MNPRQRTVSVALLLVLPGCAAIGDSTDPLQWTVGTWQGKRHAADDAVGAPMTLRVEPLTGTAGQMECLRVDGPSPYVGFATRMREPGSEHWLMVYASSAQRAFARMAGAVTTSTSTWTSTTVEPPRGSRLVFERLDADHWRRTQWVTDDGTRWQVLFHDELERCLPVPRPIP